jgi:hypothetical protein
MIKIPILLTDESLSALQILARQEFRDVRQQAAWIIEHELVERGLLVIETTPPAIGRSPAEEEGQDDSK